VPISARPIPRRVPPHPAFSPAMGAGSSTGSTKLISACLGRHAQHDDARQFDQEALRHEQGTSAPRHGVPLPAALSRLFALDVDGENEGLHAAFADLD